MFAKHGSKSPQFGGKLSHNLNLRTGMLKVAMIYWQITPVFFITSINRNNIINFLPWYFTAISQ